MKLRTLFFLTLLVLLAVACGSEVATPTPQQTATISAVAPTEAVAEAATPSAAEEITTTESVTTTSAITPTGGVDVAMAAIQMAEGVMATVNGVDITWAEYQPELLQALHSVTLSYQVDWNQAESIALLPTLQDQVLQTLVQRTLLRQLAIKEGVDLSEEEVQAYVDEQKQTILDSGQYGTWDEFKVQYGLSDEYFARLMEDNLLVEKMSEAHAPAREAEQVHARHILVADEETGNEVLTRLKAGEDFAALAAELSEDTASKENGGDLGWFPTGAMVAPFEEAAFALEVGETSGLVKSDFGYHIIEVLEKGMHELDESTYASLKSEAFATWMEEAQAAAEIQTFIRFATGE
jgi:foldase protein PrsA